MGFVIRILKQLAKEKLKQLGRMVAQLAHAISSLGNCYQVTGAVSVVDSGELEAPSELNKSKNTLVAKGKGSVQGNGSGSFLYGGNMGSGHGDPNYPAFLPVMQFGGQHPGGMGVPAVGMAFPGYVGQAQHGRGNFEMTWLPVLTGPAGALGARNWPPYLAVDGSYHARPTGQISSVTSASRSEFGRAQFEPRTTVVEAISLTEIEARDMLNKA